MIRRRNKILLILFVLNEAKEMKHDKKIRNNKFLALDSSTTTFFIKKGRLCLKITRNFFRKEILVTDTKHLSHSFSQGKTVCDDF